MEELQMTLDKMITKIDGAAGRLIVMAVRDPVVCEAMEMINEVSIALGEVEELKYYEYPDVDDEDWNND